MAQYPTAAGTDANLFVAVNNLSTTLNGAINNAVTTITVSSTTGFPTAGYITIEAEAISYTGTTATTFTGCTRGADGTAAASHVDTTPVLHDAVAAHHNVLKDEIKAVEGDLVGVMASLTPVSPANTATSILNRWAQLAQQIKNITGTTNWYDAVTKNLTQLLPLSGGTMSGAIAMGASKITGLGNGTASTDAATFGQVYYGGQAAVQSTSTTEFVTTSSTFQTSNCSATITPTTATARVKITVSAMFLNANVGVANGFYSIFRGSTDLGGATSTGFGRLTGTSGVGCMELSLVYIDSPASAAAATYSIKIRNDDSATSIKLGTTGKQIMVLEEII